MTKPTLSEAIERVDDCIEKLGEGYASWLVVREAAEQRDASNSMVADILDAVSMSPERRREAIAACDESTYGVLKRLYYTQLFDALDTRSTSINFAKRQPQPAARGGE